jgi:predicted nicotinamide N-methyase
MPRDTAGTAETPDPATRPQTAHQRFVLAKSMLRPVPLVPEIRLHLADDAISLWETIERERGEPGQPPPFWAFAWPGGQALARYIIDRPGLVAGRTVIDLGSGSGLAAIAAALAGATAVIASELDPLAATAIALNALANNAQVTVTGDVLEGAGEDADVVLAADIWYEKHLADRALGLLRRAHARGAQILVGDIGRTFLPRALLDELAAYNVSVNADLENAAVKRVMILTLSNPGAAAS